MVEHGADINLKTKDGNPPIFLALINHNIVGAKHLLKSKDIDLSIVSKDGKTIFHYLSELALHDDFMEIFKLVMAKVKDAKTLIGVTNKQGRSGLHSLVHTLTFKYSSCLGTYQSEFTAKLEKDKKKRIDSGTSNKKVVAKPAKKNVPTKVFPKKRAFSSKPQNSNKAKQGYDLTSEYTLFFHD